MSRTTSSSAHHSVRHRIGFSKRKLTALTVNGPEITKHVREVLKDDYNFDSTVSPHTALFIHVTLLIRVQNTAYALWRSFTQCLFIEDEHEAGGIVFYKNKHGEQARQLTPDALGRIQSVTLKSPKEDMTDFVS